jgi:uncharacterized membrane protein YphA (DoxX/SURF4 family)
MNFSERTYLWYIAPLRLYVGYYLLHQGIRKYQRGFPHGDWIGRQIGDLATVEIYPWYRTFLIEYVVSHREVFGYLITSGEILAGAALLLGLLTRFSASIALFMLINYYLGPGMARGGVSMAQQQMFIIALVIIFLSNAGRSLGLDGLIFSSKGKGGR